MSLLAPSPALPSFPFAGDPHRHQVLPTLNDKSHVSDKLLPILSLANDYDAQMIQKYRESDLGPGRSEIAKNLILHR